MAVTRQAAGCVVIVMGVSGSGKSTVCLALGAKLHGSPRVLDGDDFHSAANKQKMSQGIGLNDADRQDWLAAIVAAVSGPSRAASAMQIVACSALRLGYRDTLRAGIREGQMKVRFIYLRADEWLLVQRLHNRDRGNHHFAHANLLTSQLQTLEEPKNEPDVFTVNLTTQDNKPRTLDDIVDACAALLHDGSPVEPSAHGSASGTDGAT